jgi:hypothetical protein
MFRQYSDLKRDELVDSDATMSYHATYARHGRINVKTSCQDTDHTSECGLFWKRDMACWLAIESFPFSFFL